MFSECPSNVREVGKKVEEVINVSDDEKTLPEIENDSIIDGELGKRLNQLVPIPVSRPYYFILNKEIHSSISSYFILC